MLHSSLAFVRFSCGCSFVNVTTSSCLLHAAKGVRKPAQSLAAVGKTAHVAPSVSAAATATAAGVPGMPQQRNVSAKEKGSAAAPKMPVTATSQPVPCGFSAAVSL
ncbi:uncharacterized protein LOC111874161 isoform X2 [Cryptotermes secundus]|uniref:uncharacterized protein LOC111874161 isoform X2 n=1 Tax=Cryptotermes secundus TaxID=105785 RepID=UPI000CD7D3D5|nr:uncharacterized protein LOC111874161 isoform X2 [Cryptotermes secundus]